MALTSLCIVWLAVPVLSFRRQTVTAFTGPRTSFSRNDCPTNDCTDHPQRSPYSSVKKIFSSPTDDWDLEDKGEDPRMKAMRSMLETSWDGDVMGIVPSGPEKGAEAASESVADAMRQNKNVLMVDLRLPSYDITEGPELYDLMAAYDFCSFLSDKLREKDLIRKSLVLVRNEKERAEIDGVRSRRDGQENITEKDGSEYSVESKDGIVVDDFRRKLMTSWESTGGDIDTDEGGEANSPPTVSEKQISKNENSSHRLWSMVGNEEISGGPDMFDQVIAAVDENAILSAGEDALIILSPFNTADTIAVRRIMARYGQSRTIIIVNSRIEMLPRELDPAVLVYGMLPLIARSRAKDAGDEPGLKVVAMKRFPAEWSLYVDVYGDGFVEAKGTQPMVDGSNKRFPSPEWIAQRVQAHVEGLSKQ